MTQLTAFTLESTKKSSFRRYSLIAPEKYKNNSNSNNNSNNNNNNGNRNSFYYKDRVRGQNN
jgi:hypothetical protein